MSHENKYGGLQVAAATTKRRIGVKDNGSGKLTPTAAVGDAALGVLQQKYDTADDYANLSFYGVQRLLGEGAISALEFLSPSATAGAFEAAGPGDIVGALALTAAADGNDCQALVMPGGGQPLPYLVQFALTVNAENTNVIDIDVQVNDIFGRAVGEATAVEAYIVGEVAAGFHLGESGAGTELGNTDKPAITFTTDASGAAQVEVTDVVGASGDTVVVVFRPIDTMGIPAYATVTFD